MMSLNTISVKRLTLYLAPFALALSLAMDLYVPAIPKITELFQVSDKIMLLTLNLFMLTAGIMQLFIGPLSDQLGRKKIAYVTTILFTIGCMLCGFANEPNMLLFGRIVQAIGSCGMLVLGASIVRDCFSGNKSAVAYSYLNGIISFSPMFAPFIGSYIDIYFGWRATFLSLLLITGLSWISLKLYLPETLPIAKRVPFGWMDLFKRYKAIFLHPTFAVYNLGTCFGLSYLYLFCALSPYLIIRELQIPEQQYGLYFFFMGFSFFLGSIICSFVVERFNIYKTCILGFCITLFGGLWMAAWYIYAGLTLYGFVIPMLLIGIGGTFCMGAGSGGLMEPFGHNTGTAAALGGALRFLFSALAGMCVIHNDVATTLPLALPAIIFSLIGLGLFVRYKHLIGVRCYA